MPVVAKKAIVLVGPPLSGKGTLAERIADKIPRLVNVTMSRIIRDNMASIPDYESKMTQGQLLDDETCIRLWTKHVNGLPQTEKLLFDGFPRTLSQLRILKIQMDQRKWHHQIHFVLLKVGKGECQSRLQRRFTELGRADDVHNAFETRWSEWDRHGKQLLFYINSRFCVMGGVFIHDIDARGNSDDVFSQVGSKLGL